MKNYDEIPKFDLTPEIVDSETCHTWYLVSEEADIKTICAHHKFDRDCVAWDFVSDKYPTWICVADQGNGFGEIVPYSRVCDIVYRYCCDLHKNIEKEEAKRIE